MLNDIRKQLHGNYVSEVAYRKAELGKHIKTLFLWDKYIREK